MSQERKLDVAYWMVVVGAVLVALAVIFLLFALVNSGNEIPVHQPVKTTQV